MEHASSQVTPAFVIIQATKMHVPLVAPLFDGYRQFYGQASDLSGAEAFLAARLSESSSTVLLAVVSEPSGAALGFIQLYPSFSSISLCPIWILNDLFVAPEARRRGVGKALMERARAFAAASGAIEMRLETAVTNASAQALYESIGWQRDEEFFNYMLPL
jgi:ribosomal protein S18 acetylase RimI-like enzyme